MRVKLKHDFNYVDEDEDGMSSITFNKGHIYDVIYEFEHEDWISGRVYVIINNNGETMSVDKSLVEVIQDETT